MERNVLLGDSSDICELVMPSKLDNFISLSLGILSPHYVKESRDLT